MTVPPRALPALALCALIVSACAEPAKKEIAAPRAQFGVFFGGQVQERRDVPFELDRSKQTLGFRIEFPAPLAEDVRVEWRLSPPAKAGKIRGTGGAAAIQEPRIAASDVARAGETRFERTTPLQAGDPLGIWNARVVAGGKVLIDRPFEVYDAALRAQAARKDAGF